MNYFFDSVFKDKNHWKKILIIITIIVALIDLRFSMFDGKIFLIIVVLSTLSLIVLGIRIVKRDKESANIIIEQKLFEGKKRLEFKNIIRENSEFQTFCFKCSHFNDKRRACKISFDVIDKRALKTKFADNKFEYCLYWEDRNN